MDCNTNAKKLNEPASHLGHRKRMYEKYRESGFGSFSENQVLEMLLYNCYIRKDTNQIAHNLLEHFGCLENVINANVDELIIAGLSERSAIIINEYHELNKYLNINKKEKIILSDFSVAGQYCCEHFGDNNIESLFVICMDNSSKIKGVRKISEGTEQKTENFPLEILRAAMVMRATNVILCHNHPSGNLKPSNDDIINTNKIAILLESAEIHLIDHIICSKDKFVSLAQRGILKN